MKTMEAACVSEEPATYNLEFGGFENVLRDVGVRAIPT